MADESGLDLAGIYGAGALDGDELSRSQAHRPGARLQRRARIRRPREALASLSASLQPTTPADSVKEKLLERIDSEKPGLVYIHANDGKWIEAEPGIFAKILNLDTERR